MLTASSEPVPDTIRTCSVAEPISIRDGITETIETLRPALRMESSPRFGQERSLVDRQYRRFVALLEPEHDDRLLIVGVGILVAKRVAQLTGNIDSPELADQRERIPVRWLHRDPIPPSDPHVEVDTRSGEPLG